MNFLQGLFEHLGQSAIKAFIGLLSAPPPKPGKFRAAPGEGKVRLNKDSSLRKVMRAARRGKLSGETLRAIEDAQSKQALMRHAWYRRKVAWAALRQKAGQPQPGDDKLLGALRWPG